MERKTIENFLVLLDTIVQNSQLQWRAKVDAILEIASASDKANIAEFCSWFPSDMVEYE